MNKLITTAGLAALGAVAATQAQSSSMNAQRPWSVSASLRGFYDDNYVTLGNAAKRDSYGFDLSPSAGYNVVREQTSINLSYLYSMRYFEDRISDRADHSHQANAKLSHAFTERYKMDVSDSFVIAQEPDVIDPGTRTSPLRTEGDVLRNTGSISLTSELTEQLQAQVGYSNNFYDYKQDTAAGGGPSRSGLLDRIEHLISLNGSYQIVQKTRGILGYQYGVTDFTSQDSIGTGTGGVNFIGDDRDSSSHYAFVGVDQMINPKLVASGRVGLQYVEYDNAKKLNDNGKTSPYADANATWNYNPGSSLQLGLRHSRNATDVGLQAGAATPVLDAETTTIYGSLNHRITAMVSVGLVAQYQNSSFDINVPGQRDPSDDYGMLGLSATYQITKNVAAEAGYNYDRLSSDLAGRSYTRNRIYVGGRFSY